MEELGRYTLLSRISEGHDGDKIKLLFDKVNCETVVCKVFNRKEDDFMSIEEEIRIQERMNHPFIAPIKDIVYSRENIYVIMKYYKQGDLLSLLQSQMLGMRESIRIFSQIVEAVSYLHTRGVAHLDIKPENIFIDEDFNAILADFGCCETEESRNKPYKPRGTLLYAAPESFTEECMDHRPVDIWSLGILLHLMVTKKLPYKSGSEEYLTRQVLDGDIGELVPELGIYADIVAKCLKKNPKERISVFELYDLIQEFSPIIDTNLNAKHRSSMGSVRTPRNKSIVKPRAIQSVVSFSSKVRLSCKRPILNVPSKSKVTLKYPAIKRA